MHNVKMQAIEDAIENFKYKYGNCVSFVNTNCDTYTIQASRLGKTPIEFSINKYQTLQDLYTLAEQQITLLNPHFREASAGIEMTEIYLKNSTPKPATNTNINMPEDDDSIRAIFFARGGTPITINCDPNIRFIDFLIENKQYMDSSFSGNKFKFYVIDCECFRRLIVKKMRAAYS
jgi:hypothetical protein